jgi:UDP-N-acetylmuramyl pentapeptide phosphotransferase/UDP-N-acetylglucosamine-1-phosphate transferase
MTGLLVPMVFGAVFLWWQAEAGGPRETSFNAGSKTQQILTLAPLDAQSVARLEHGFERRKLELAGIFLGALGMLILGILDDKHELRPRVICGQLLVAFLVAACGARRVLPVVQMRVQLRHHDAVDHPLINAFNFMDNMNGLCAGLGAIAPVFCYHCRGRRAYLVALCVFRLRRAARISAV